jgi:hypothetical protein
MPYNIFAVDGLEVAVTTDGRLVAFVEAGESCWVVAEEKIEDELAPRE